MKSLIKLWRYIKSNLANYNIFNCKIHLLEKIIFWFFAIFWLFAIFFILYNLQFEFMMLYEYEEDFNKYVKIIKGAKDIIKNAILNVSSNSNGLSNNINGVSNSDNSDINAAIEYLIANTNFTFDDIIAVSESVGSLELGVSILTAGGIIGGVVITPGFNISDLQNEDNNNNNSNNNNSNNNNEVNNNSNNSNNEVNNNNNNSNNEVNNNNSNNNNINSNNSNDINNNSSNDNFNNNDGSFSANCIIEEGDSIDSVINIICFNLFTFFSIFLLFILLIYLYKNRKAILLFITRIYLILFSSIFLYIVYNLSDYISLISII